MLESWASTLAERFEVSVGIHPVRAEATYLRWLNEEFSVKYDLSAQADVEGGTRTEERPGNLKSATQAEETADPHEGAPDSSTETEVDQIVTLSTERTDAEQPGFGFLGDLIALVCGFYMLKRKLTNDVK